MIYCGHLYLYLAIAAQVGTGNVVGASTAIAVGGPVYYITSAFKNSFGKFLAVFFALLIIISLGFMGCAVQSNGIADAWKTVFVDSFGIDAEKAGMIIIIIGIILAKLVWALLHMLMLWQRLVIQQIKDSLL